MAGNEAPTPEVPYDPTTDVYSDQWIPRWLRPGAKDLAVDVPGPHPNANATPKKAETAPPEIKP